MGKTKAKRNYSKVKAYVKKRKSVEDAQNKDDEEQHQQLNELERQKIKKDRNERLEQQNQFRNEQECYFQLFEQQQQLDDQLLAIGIHEKELETDTDKSQTILLTEAILDQWKASATSVMQNQTETTNNTNTTNIPTHTISETTSSISACKQLVKAFYTACTINSSHEGQNFGSSFEISSDRSGGAVFESIIRFSLSSLVPIFTCHLQRSKDKDKDQDQEDEEKAQENEPETGLIRKGFLPQKFPGRWSKIKNMVQVYLRGLLVFMRNLTDTKMLLFVLQSAKQIIPFFGPFPEETKIFLKRLLELWVHPEESIRISAFLNIFRVGIDLPYPYINLCLKGTYLSFVHNTKFYNSKIEGLVNFLSQCFVELYGIDFVASYEHASVYLRHISIQLREAHITKSSVTTSSSYESICNWQTLQSINLWVKLLCAYPNKDNLWSLSQPIYQILHGLITLFPTPSYYPVRCHSVRMMNKLLMARSNVKPVFLNPVSYLVEMILNYCSSSSNSKPFKGEEIDMRFTLKVPESYLGTKIFVDSLLDEIHENLVLFFCCYDTHISFPELAQPLIIVLKNFITKEDQISPSVLKIKSLVEVLQQNSNLITTKRNAVNFSPNNTQKVDLFTRQFKQLTPLQRYYQQQQQKQKQQHQKEQSQNEQQDELDDEEDDDEVHDDEPTAAHPLERDDEDDDDD